MSGIRIDELDQTVLPSRDHVLPAMKDGISVQLAVMQILSLISRTDLAGKLFGADVAFDPSTGGPLVAENVQSAIDEMLVRLVATFPQSLSPAEQAQARANIGAGILAGFRNKIINGDFTINQRGGTRTPGIGVYGYDRWKGHASGLEQIIEDLPAGTYTLTFGGGGTGSVDGQTPAASPAVFTVATGGNISVVVPATATRVSLVPGDATAEDDPFSPRHIQQELALCQRYYSFVRASIRYHAASAGVRFDSPIYWPNTMRTTPSIITGGSEANSNLTPGVSGPTSVGARLATTSLATGDAHVVNLYVGADAEL